VIVLRRLGLGLFQYRALFPGEAHETFLAGWPSPTASGPPTGIQTSEPPAICRWLNTLDPA